MRYLWISIFFLSLAWLLMIPVYTVSSTDSYNWIFFLLIAVIVGTVGLRKIELKRVDWKQYFLSIPLLLTIFIFPFPYYVGPSLILAGLIVTLGIKYYSKLTYLSIALMFCGVILVFQSVFTPAYFIFASRFHEISWLTPPLYFLVDTLGLNVSLSQNTIFVQEISNVSSFTTTVERLGLYPLLNILLAGSLLFILAPIKRKGHKFVLFLIICFLFVILRHVYLIFTYIDIQRADMFWRTDDIFISFLPLVLLLFLLFPFQTANPSKLHLEFSANRNNLILCATCFLFVFSIVGFWNFQDSGTPKDGRILIDEKHSNWEWSTTKLDTLTYGVKTVYNYYDFARYLNYYYHVERNFEKITPEKLAKCDVLILKTVTEPFSEDEVDAIEAFVKHGGGLFLVSDHTNIFGMSTNINPIADRFGMHFNHDACYDLVTSGRSVYRHPTVLAHPIVQNMPPFMFLTSCSMDATLSAENVILGYSLGADKLDYSVNTFFGDFKQRTDENFGLFLQMVAVKYGKGRVAGFSDSTVFSNFSMFIPGKSELALGTIEWLNRRNKFDYINKVLLIIALFSLPLIFYLAFKIDKQQLLLSLFSTGLLTVSLSVFVFHTLNRSSYIPPKSHTKFIKVCFEQEYSHYVLPILRPMQDNSPVNYLTFFVWTQKLDLVPSVSNSLEKALESDAIVMINPIKPFSQEDLTIIAKYIENGGKLLVMDSPYNTLSSANQLLKIFDMVIDFTQIDSSKVYKLGPKEFVYVGKHLCTVAGGEPLLCTANDIPVLSVTRKGKGAVIVMTNSNIFSNMVLGENDVIPDERQLQLNNLEFWLFKHLLKK